MATICEKCGASVDNRDTACPVCGFPLDPDPSFDDKPEKTVSKFHFTAVRPPAGGETPRDESFGSDREWTDKPKHLHDDEPGFVMSEKHRRLTEPTRKGPQIDDFRSDTLEEMYPGTRRPQPKPLQNDTDPDKVRDTSRELEKVLGSMKSESQKPDIHRTAASEDKQINDEAVPAPKTVAPRQAPPPVPKTPVNAIPKLRPKPEALLRKTASEDSVPAWTREANGLPDGEAQFSQAFDDEPHGRSGFKLEAPIEPQYKNVKTRPVAPRKKTVHREVDDSDTLPIMSTIREKEEQNEEIQVIAANFPARLIAGAIDQAIVLILSYIFINLTIWIMGAEFIPENKGVLSLLTDYPVILPSCATIYLFIFLLYTVWMDSLTGQTVGKMLMKLRLVQMDGERPHPLRSVIRQAAYFISLMIFGLGHFLVLFDSRKQSLHDKIAGTLVIRCTE